jgi:hypothetical protein
MRPLLILVLSGALVLPATSATSLAAGADALAAGRPASGAHTGVLSISLYAGGWPVLRDYEVRVLGPAHFDRTLTSNWAGRMVTSLAPGVYQVTVAGQRRAVAVANGVIRHAVLDVGRAPANMASAVAAQSQSALVSQVIAKLPAGRTLANASAAQLRRAVGQAAAEASENAANMVVETLQALAKAAPQGSFQPAVLAAVRGGLDGAPNFAAEIAEATIGAFPEYSEVIRRLLTNAGGAGGGGEAGPGIGGGPGGVGGGGGGVGGAVSGGGGFGGLAGALGAAAAGGVVGYAANQNKSDASPSR